MKALKLYYFFLLYSLQTLSPISLLKFTPIDSIPFLKCSKQYHYYYQLLLPLLLKLLLPLLLLLSSSFDIITVQLPAFVTTYFSTLLQVMQFRVSQFFISAFRFSAVHCNTFDLSDSSVQFILHFYIFSNALCVSFSCHFICFQQFMCACLHCVLMQTFELCSSPFT